MTNRSRLALSRAKQANSSASLALQGKSGNSPYYPTRAAAVNAGVSGAIPSWATSIDIGGYTVESDCPKCTYRWMSSFNSGWSNLVYFADTSSRGGYWVYSEPELDPRHFGAVNDRFSYENAVISTSTPNQFTVASGYFTSGDIGKPVGLDTGGPATPAIFKMEILLTLYSGRTLTINGQVITFVASGATGFQVNNTGYASSYAFAQAIAALINTNTATFACTAVVSDRTLSYNLNYTPVITLVANTAGSAGNAITVSTTCELWMLWRYNDTFYNGKDSGPLVTTITSVSGTIGSSQTIGISTPVLTSATAVNASGGTDNSTAFNAALTMASGDNGLGREFGSGAGGFGEYGRRPIVVRQESTPIQHSTVYGGGHTKLGYGVISPLVINSYGVLKIDISSSLCALPGFPSGRAVVEVWDTWSSNGTPNANVSAITARIEGPGAIIAMDWAERGVWLRACQYGYVGAGLRVMGASYKGIEFGDVDGRGANWGNELGSVYIVNKCSKTNTNGTNRADSVGFHCSTNTDAIYSGKCDVAGYRFGITIDRDSTFPQSHSWTWKGGGPMKASYLIRYANVTLIGAESDTPSSQGDASVGEPYALWTVASQVTAYGINNVNAGASNGGADNEQCFIRNEGAAYSSIQPQINLYNSRTTGAICKRAAIGPGTWKAGSGGVSEGYVRFIGGLLTDQYISQTGFHSSVVEPSGFKNVIDNSTFNIWRTTTDQNVLVTGPVYGAELWRLTSDCTGGTRVMRQANSPQLGNPRLGAQYALEIESTALPTSGTYQRLSRRLSRKVLTGLSSKVVTLIVNSSFVSGNWNGLGASCKIIQNFGTGGSSTVTTTLGSIYGVTEYALTALLPTVNGLTVAADAYLEIQIDIPISGTPAAWKLDISSIELVQGLLTANERISPPIDDSEKFRVQAYYESGSMYAVTTSAVWIPFKIQKRSVPIVTPSSGSATNITIDGFVWTPSSTGAATYTADSTL